MNTISFDVNNGRTLKLVQRQHDGSTLIMVEDSCGNCESINDEEALISPGDFVMLINYFRYIKSHDYRHDFINSSGTNTEPR